MATIRERRHTAKWDGFEPELALLGGILQQACRDALQTANERLHAEAWEFLHVCAPDVAERLHTQPTGGDNANLALCDRGNPMMEQITRKPHTSGDSEKV